MSHEAFTAACLKYERDLLRVARRFTRDRDRAHDLVQDTWLKAMIAWDVETVRNPFSWLFTLMLRLHVDDLRCTKRRAATSAVDMLIASRGCDSTFATLTDHDMRAYSAEMVAALGALSHREREALQLVAEGDKYHEIATRHGVPVGTTMSDVYRGRRKMRAALSPR